MSLNLAQYIGILFDPNNSGFSVYVCTYSYHVCFVYWGIIYLFIYIVVITYIRGALYCHICSYITTYQQCVYENQYGIIFIECLSIFKKIYLPYISYYTVLTVYINMYRT